MIYPMIGNNTVFYVFIVICWHCSYVVRTLCSNSSKVSLPYAICTIEHNANVVSICYQVFHIHFLCVLKLCYTKQPQTEITSETLFL